MQRPQIFHFYLQLLSLADQQAQGMNDKDNSKAPQRATLTLKPADSSKVAAANPAAARPLKGVIVETTRKRRRVDQSESVGSDATTAPASVPAPAATPVAVKKTFSSNAAPRATGGGVQGRQLTSSEMEARTRALELAKQNTPKLVMAEDALLVDKIPEPSILVVEAPVLEPVAVAPEPVVVAAPPLSVVSHPVAADAPAAEMPKPAPRLLRGDLPVIIKRATPLPSSVSAASKAAPDKAPLSQGTTQRRVVVDEAETFVGGRNKSNTNHTPIASARNKAAPATTAKPTNDAGKDRRRLTVLTALSDDDERTRSVAAYRRRTAKNRQRVSEPAAKVYREVIVPDTITVQELASRMTERSAAVIKELMKLGIMGGVNHVLDADTAQLVVEAMGHTIKRVSESDLENSIKTDDDIEENKEPRAPIVTIMGHVDHGKTSLLDALRQTSVVSGEAGGITQHIGAYRAMSTDGRPITFIDTPGHSAFTAMRARGAKITDIVVLVVAADDGVMPQTIEAISHAQAANVPIVVAINKIDKPDAKPDRVRNELLSHNIVVESMGGEVLDIEVSALQRLNLDKLLDAILLQAEILSLQANPHRPAEGTVVEARLDKGRGAVATVLIQRGTLKTGDIVVAGTQWGRVRAMTNERGEKLSTVTPSVPAEILGLDGVPAAGDEFQVVENETSAREVAEYRQRKQREAATAPVVRSMDMLMAQMGQAEKRTLPLVVKADVHGSLEAIVASLQKLGNDEVSAQIIHYSVGGITESDIMLANTTNAAVVAFNVRAVKQARDLADREKIDIRYYSVIYDLLDDVKSVLSGLLAPTLREKFLGNAEIMQVFDISKVGKIAGCRITEGIAKRAAKVRLIRENVVIHEGTLSTLRRFKDEVKEVRSGYECGMAFERYEDIRVGDIIEVFEIESIARSL